MPQNKSAAENEPKTFEEILAETTDVAAMVSSPAWAKYMLLLQGWEQEAMEDMRGNLSKEMAWSFQSRWKQREDIVRLTATWADMAVKQRDLMIQELKQELEIA